MKWQISPFWYRFWEWTIDTNKYESEINGEKYFDNLLFIGPFQFWYYSKT